MSAIRPAARRWRQTWVDASGQVTDYHGARNSAGELVFLADVTTRAGKQVRRRMTFTRLNEDQVRQHIEDSEDGGKTWRTGFDGLYTREESTKARSPQ